MDGCSEIVEDWFCSYWFLSVLDIAISNFVIAPCVVGFWRGAWEFMFYFNEEFPFGWCLYVSTGLHFTFALIRESLIEKFKYDRGLLYFVVSRCYIYVFGLCCAMQWSSTWHILEVYIGYDSNTVLMFTVPSLILSLIIKVFGNVIAPPYAIALDSKPEDVFDFPTMFKVPASYMVIPNNEQDAKSKGSKDTWLYILDCFFSVFIIGTLVVFVWRGVWCLLDIYLFPGREDLSAWGSLAMGYILVFSTFATQPLVKSLVVRVSGFWRLVTVDIYLLFSFCGTVNVWRGVWNLLNIYFLPDRRVTSYWVTHVACFLLLLFINSSNSILVRGVYIDAEEEGAQCVDFPCYYLRLFFQARRRKKILRQLQKRQIANLVGKKNETDVYPVPVVQDGIEKTKQPQIHADPSQAV